MTQMVTLLRLLVVLPLEEKELQEKQEMDKNKNKK